MEADPRVSFALQAFATSGLVAVPSGFQGAIAESVKP